MMKRTRAGLVVAAALSLAVAAPAVAQAPSPSPSPSASPEVVIDPRALLERASRDEGKFQEFDHVVKDMVKLEGLMTLYRHKADDNTKDQSKLLAQIPKKLLGQDLLLATSISRGGMSGFQWNDYLVRMRMQGRKVMVEVPDLRFIETPDKPVTAAVTRTYTPSFLAALPIVTMSPQGDPVVDLTPLVMGRAIGLPSGGMFGGGAASAAGAEPRRDLSSYSKVKVFPENLLIDVDLATVGRHGSGQTVGVSYAFRALPENKGYKTRVADERVGYFTTVRQDWNAKHSDRENLVRYINRWDLKKKDPSLELSPPEKPIVFVIEKTVPLQWRKYVHEGVREWNKAYEQIGIVDAIVVQQQTDDNEFADVDPEDARYNFLRWVVTGNAFAMGPSRADPRTGQILDADIIFDDAMLRYFAMDFDVFGPGTVSAIMGPEMAEFMTANPAYIPAGVKPEDMKQAADGSELLRARDAASMEGPSNLGSARLGANSPCSACTYATGLRHQLAVTHLAIVGSASGKKIPERFIGEAIKEVVAHEVGHTLGLRHNFKASSWLGVEEIKRRRDTTDEPTFASVMDYNPLLFFPGDDPEKVRHFISPCIGPYDYWAVEYGYKTPTKDDGDEAKMLAAIAQKGTKRELAYATDEDTMGLSSPDPMVNRFDMSDDPIGWARQRIALSDQLMKDVKNWAVKKDEPNYYLRQVFATILYEKTSNLNYVSRVVGGQNFNRNRAGDPEAKPAFVLLDPKQQRDAMTMLGETLFADNFFAVESDLLNDLGPSRWWDWASVPSSRMDFPIHQTILNMQSYALFNLCAPQVMQRVYDAEMKSKADDKFTAAELVANTRQIIWGNLDLPHGSEFTDAKPMLGSVRRNLQRQHLQYLLATVDSTPGALVSPDLQSMVAYSLRELSDQMGVVLDKAKTANNGKLDFATKAHLSECKSKIDRVLNAPHIKVPAAPQQVIIMGG
jgi:hypothetical protein